MPAAYTPRDLFRAGNATGPKLDVRAKDVIVFPYNNDVWVIAYSGGVSVWDAVRVALRGPWYQLPAGTVYDDAALYPYDDQRGHWTLQPARHMRLAEYVAALATLAPKFIRV
jgi:hypothetical protein